MWAGPHSIETKSNNITSIALIAPLVHKAMAGGSYLLPTWGKTFSGLSTPRAGVGRDVADAMPDSIAQAFSQGPALTRPAWPLPLGKA